MSLAVSRDVDRGVLEEFFLVLQQACRAAGRTEVSSR